MKKREPILHGTTKKIDTSCGKLYLTVNKQGGEIFEVYWRMGKSGHCISARNAFEGALLSKLFQSDMPKCDIADFLLNHALGVNCGQPFTEEGEKHASCLDVIAKELIKQIEKK
jgi:ribonucleoside-diphosphate reductase alpha chain